MSERVPLRRLIDAEYHSHMLLRELHALEAEAAPYNMRVVEMLSQLREIDTDLTAWRMDRESDPDEEPAEGGVRHARL